MPKQTVSASMSEELVARLEQRAEDSGLSKSALVVMAVERMLAPPLARQGGADLSEFQPVGFAGVQSTGPVVDAEPDPASDPPRGTFERAKIGCNHPVSRRSGGTCMACGARNVR